MSSPSTRPNFHLSPRWPSRGAGVRLNNRVAAGGGGPAIPEALLNAVAWWDPRAEEYDGGAFLLNQGTGPGLTMTTSGVFDTDHLNLATGQYCRVDDNDLIDFAFLVPYTMGVVVETNGALANYGTYMSKATLGGAGFTIYSNTTSELNAYINVHNDNFHAVNLITPSTVGTRRMFSIRRDPTVPIISCYTNDAVGDTSTDSFVGQQTMINTGDLIFGVGQVGQNSQPFKFFGAFVARTALSPTDLAEIAAYFGAA